MLLLVDLIVLFGLKSVCVDFVVLCECGWDEVIFCYLCYGGCLLGICGGL